jgi:hypothetical protein
LIPVRRHRILRAMKHRLKFLARLGVTVLLAGLIVPPTTADADMKTGVTAYKTGDYNTAFREFKKLAEVGNPNAQFSLAVLYLSGRGVKRDVAQAIDWHRKAAGQGLASAEHGLGVFYYQGMGVEQDYAEALKWFKRAATKGFAESEFNLAAMYFNGQGVQRDNIEVVKWVTLAAARKFAPAQFRMGQMYEQGVLFTRDPESAIHWYRQAETNGSKKAPAALARLTRPLNGPAAAKAAPARAPTEKPTGKPPESEAKPSAKVPAPIPAPPLVAPKTVPVASPASIALTRSAPTVAPTTAPPPAALKAADTPSQKPIAKAVPSVTPSPPKPPPLKSDGWKNPFSLSPVPNAESPVQANPDTARTETSTIADTVTDAGGPSGTASPNVQTTGPEWRVQFAAYRSAKEAKQALIILNDRASAAIGRTPRIIDVADLGDQGVFHRLQAGPLASPEDAAKLCILVKAVLPHQSCVPTQVGER